MRSHVPHSHQKHAPHPPPIPLCAPQSGHCEREIVFVQHSQWRALRHPRRSLRTRCQCPAPGARTVSPQKLRELCGRSLAPLFLVCPPVRCPFPFNFLRSLDGPPPPSPALVSDYQSID